MKIFLIQLPNIVTDDEARHLPPYLSVGLGIIAAVVRDHGHQVKLLDAYTEGWENRARIEGEWIEIGLAEEEIAAQIRRFQPQVVGFSVPFTSMVPRLRSLARWVKAIHPEIFVVCGGNHPTCVPAEVLNIPDVDAVVLGEAENSFPRLLQALEDGENPDNLPGIMGRSNLATDIKTHSANSVKDLDTLPLPAYDLLPLKKYFKAAGGRKIPLFSSRGCGRHCASCSMPLIFPGPTRRFSPPYISQSVRHLTEFYGVREFIFDDDGLTNDAMAAHRLFDHLRAENLRVVWTARGGVNPHILDESLLTVMRASGGKNMRLEIGSGSRRVLHRVLNKSLDLHDVEVVVSRIRAAGMTVNCEFLLGSPGTSIEEVYESLNFAWKLRSHGAEEFSFLLSTPYVGTDLRRQALALGRPVPSADPDFLSHHNLVATQDLTAMEISQIRDTAQREFNSRGLVVELGKLVGVGAKSTPKLEDRFFASVAPWPVLHQEQRKVKERERMPHERA